MQKIVSREKIIEITREAKKRGKKIVFTNGCFDILHAGHVKYLNKAKNLGDILIVGLNSDSSIKKIKGKNRPINPQGDRAIVLSGLECIDYITIFNEETPENLIKLISPKILVKGNDWKGKKVAGSDIVIKNGGRVVFLPLLKGRSTSEIIKKIKAS